MRSAEIVIVVALLVGVAIGQWFERGRIGGTAHMRRQRDNARRACDVARAERDQLLALDQLPPGDNHPARTMYLVRSELPQPSGRVLELRPSS